jgi:hypothetical protein
MVPVALTERRLHTCWPDSPQPTTAVIGHSFLRYMDQYFDTNHILSPVLAFVPGGYVSDLYHCIDALPSSVTTLFIIAGSNDLCSRDASPSSVLGELLTVTHYAQNNLPLIENIFISTVTHRYTNQLHRARNPRSEQTFLRHFWRRANELNSKLLSFRDPNRLVSAFDAGLSLEPARKVIARDGVHPTRFGRALITSKIKRTCGEALIRSALRTPAEPYIETYTTSLEAPTGPHTETYTTFLQDRLKPNTSTPVATNSNEHGAESTSPETQISTSNSFSVLPLDVEGPLTACSNKDNTNTQRLPAPKAHRPPESHATPATRHSGLGLHEDRTSAANLTHPRRTLLPTPKATGGSPLFPNGTAGHHLRPSMNNDMEPATNQTLPRRTLLPTPTETSGAPFCASWTASYAPAGTVLNPQASPYKPGVPDPPIDQHQTPTRPVSQMQRQASRQHAPVTRSQTKTLQSVQSLPNVTSSNHNMSAPTPVGLLSDEHYPHLHSAAPSPVPGAEQPRSSSPLTPVAPPHEHTDHQNDETGSYISATGPTILAQQEDSLF